MPCAASFFASLVRIDFQFSVVHIYIFHSDAKVYWLAFTVRKVCASKDNQINLDSMRNPDSPTTGLKKNHTVL